MSQLVWRSLKYRQNVTPICAHTKSSITFKSYSTELNAHKRVLDDLAKELNVNKMSDWYKIKDLEYKLDNRIYAKYKNSPYNLLSSIYPEYTWLPWKFDRIGSGYWHVPENQRKFLDWAATKLNIKEIEDWYKVDVKSIASVGGSGLVSDYYNGSVSKLVMSVYSEYDWKPWKFESSPRNLWDDVNEQKKFMIWAGKELGIKEMSDWYNVTTKKLTDMGGYMIRGKYDGSICKFLSTLYPEHEWLPWKFQSCPHNFWTDLKNQRWFMDWAGKQFGIKEMSDWYKITGKDISEVGGNGLLTNYYDSSVRKLLQTVFPEYEWRFQELEAERKDPVRFIDLAAKEFNITKIEDWYKINAEDLKRVEGGKSILSQFGGSAFKLLSFVFPDFEWQFWRFANSPHNFWSDINEQRRFLEWAGQQLQIKDLSSWYKLENQQELFGKLGGLTLLSQYSGSTLKLFSTVYPDYQWLPWKFKSIPKHFWEDTKNQKSFVKWASNELGIKEMSDWYNIRTEQIYELGGQHLLQSQYNNSLPKMLSAVYPDFDWSLWKFKNLQLSAKDGNTAANFMDMIGKELNIKDLSDWYNITREDITKFDRGTAKLDSHNGSRYRLYVDAYPNYPWLPWRFPRARDYWEDSKYARQFMNTVASRLNVKQPSDWYNIKSEQVIDLDGGCLIVKYRSLAQLLSIVYPEFKWDFGNIVDIWDDEKLAKYYVERLKKQSEPELLFLQKTIKNTGRKGIYTLTQMLKAAFPQYIWITSGRESLRRSQYMLKDSLHSLFAGEVLEEYKHPDMVYLELDYFYPQYKLAFEYQGEQHYRNVNVFHRMDTLASNQNRDQSKSDICQSLGITLIEVPYWWDKKPSSLASTIYNVRPDLFSTKPKGKPIPPSPFTSSVGDVEKKKPKKREVMTVMEWEKSMEPTGWYMTEKYDGMRLYWNGNKCLSRQGEKVPMPESMSMQLPSGIALDGELWTQYGLYQDAVSLARTSNEAKWNKSIFWVFDAPHLDKPLEERIELLKSLTLPPFAKVVDFVKCKGMDHLEEFSSQIVAKGGEGVILREPGSLYKAGRSSSIRRYKPFLDSEVRVIRNQYPHGFVCEQPNGKEVFVKLIENFEEARQVKEGAVITVKHGGVNVRGTLQYPYFWRERLELKWSDVGKSL